MTRRFRKRNVSRGADLESQARDEGVPLQSPSYSPLTHLSIEARQREAHEMNTRTSGRNVKDSRASGSNEPAVQEVYNDQVDSSARSQGQAQTDSRQPGGGDHSSDTSEMPPMIGDFDDNANAFWSLHMKEAKSHDEARIESIKDDMDGVLIFVCIYISTSFSSPS